MSYTVLSPWARRKIEGTKPLNKRIENLNGKTVGLLSLFKEYDPYFMRIVGKELFKAYPLACFTEYVYKVDQMDIEEDYVNYQSFKEWVDSVDIVVGMGADAGSCSIYAGYIFAVCEKLGKPTVMWVCDVYSSAANCGLAAKGYSNLRKVYYETGFGTVPPGVDIETYTEQVYGDEIRALMQECIAAMTAPLTAEEINPVQLTDYADASIAGEYDELNRLFYKNGWTNGTPIVPPTEEAVAEMCRGTDLPRDYVVACLPPMMGEATVEKIAVNAVMAGCHPVHMPIIIAIVRALSDPKLLKPFTSCPTPFPMLNLECQTCSTAAFAPLFVISGPITKSLGMYFNKNYLSPYDVTKSSIPRAYSYIILNIAGVRTKTEDMSFMGHESRFGVCIAENTEESPWPGLAFDFGYDKDDSCVVVN